MDKDKLKQEVGGFQDVATDLRDVWSDLNNHLDYEDKQEKEILDSFLGLIIGLEEEIQNSLSVVEKLFKEEYKSIQIPIGEEDIRMFEELVEGGDSFTWTFDKVNVEFIKDDGEE